ncbi:hypothetical protein B4123_0653 [Bacillus paralicheniformis]|uniref:Uncharacterized protein n=1 Tax=Bacillus paralicheniformis TaxID=1648923 RepID=A0ABY3FSL4_9BACI|nr:hypothetical protein SC10_B2orf06121 [Bacillus paralicheniformis]OLG05107.1 hypothetical protein B4125_3179 [Bacillus paralicheniformis]OLG12924.1 hypothetical protein B4123_0653 [Bacillus paralicheniformis]TWJ56470.1 hypothetical protein CHCC5023_3564 [Bacillus paralicheniformis]TWJ75395.1 hypothetical protein CHCC5019_2066 [Bacillus paralicheniformis]
MKNKKPNWGSFFRQFGFFHLDIEQHISNTIKEIHQNPNRKV